ncbi:hypothetical protein Trihar35433_11272 [Trichoderma harzianum]|nr:hypothetical protein Trihar35433_11272 [Trichoderma harzianum]
MHFYLRQALQRGHTANPSLVDNFNLNQDDSGSSNNIDDMDMEIDDADDNGSGSGSDSNSADTIDFDNLDLNYVENEDDEDDKRDALQRGHTASANLDNDDQVNNANDNAIGNVGESGDIGESGSEASSHTARDMSNQEDGIQPGGREPTPRNPRLRLGPRLPVVAPFPPSFLSPPLLLSFFAWLMPSRSLVEAGRVDLSFLLPS